MNRPLLTELTLDLQIHICEFLHPSQILALRQTCKAFHEATSLRIVWIHALNRICYSNSLFLPTFPIHDMSEVELESAATAPLRWTALSSSKDRNNEGFLPLRTTRIIKNPIASMVNTLQLPEYWWSIDLIDLYLVPGGRYLVISGPDCLGVWDLRYVSDGDISSDRKPTKMWATTVNYIADFLVHPTPDGLGIRILTYSPPLRDALYVFEIYPQRETPELAKIAELILDLHEREDIIYSLNGNRVIIYGREKGTVIVWDFVADTVASWSISSPHLMDQIIKVTEAAIIILHTRSTRPSLWIFEIPPLITKTPLFDSEEDLPEVAPVITFKLPKGALCWCQKPDGWYSGDLSSLPLYIDVLKSRKSHDFGRSKLNVACDLNTVFLVPMVNPTMQYSIDDRHMYDSMAYRICEDVFVNVSTSFSKLAVYTSSTSSGTAVGSGPSSDYHRSQPPILRVNMVHLAVAHTPYSFCPASARLVYTDDGDIIISDFL